MKKVVATIMVLLVSIALLNIPADICTTASAGSGEDYPYTSTDNIIIEAVDYLRSRQSADGGIGGFSASSWVAMAIASAGEDPHDWGDLVAYLRENVGRIDEDIATDWERQLLAIVACNENPRDFGDIDYLAKVESFYDGVQIGSSANLYDDFFGILALVSGGIDEQSSIAQNVKAYIKEKQNENGGWGDVDSTAAAIMALITAGEYSNSDCIIGALSYMKTTQLETGGFQSWGTANAASTAWAVNAIVATGGDPTTVEWKNSGNSPIDFLLSLQQENGCFNWAINQNVNPEWMTSYVIPALLGKPYPVKIYKPGGGNGNNNAGNVNNGANNGGDDDTGNGDNNVDNDEWTGNIRIEGQTDTIWNGEVIVSSTTINALNDSSGEIEEYFIPYPSVLGALDEAAQQGGFSYFVIYYPSWNAFYVKTIADESDWWHYWVDYTLPMVGVGAYELTEEDEEGLFGYLEDWTAHALRMTIDKTVVNESEEFTVTVYNETMSPVDDAEVYVDSMVYTTDENGTVTVHIDIAGDYVIYSEKNGYVRSEKVTVLVKTKKIVEIIKPVNHAIYLLNRKIDIRIPKILIIGHIDIEVETTDDVEKVEFYIDGKLEYTDVERPFNWRLNERAFFKKETIRVEAYTNNDDIILKIQKIIRYIDTLPEDHHETLTLIKSYLKSLEVSHVGQSDFDEKEVVFFNLFPRIHIL